MRRSTRIALRRSLRRTVYWLVLPLLFLLVFRLFWGYHASRRLQATLARLDTLHVRYRPEQYPDTSAIPAADNAVDALLAGPLGISPTYSEDRLINDPIEFQTPSDYDAILKQLAAHKDILDRIDDAQSRPTIAWPARDMCATGSLPRLTGAVQYGRLLFKAAEVTHVRHDDALALRHLNRLLTVARVFERSPIMIHVLLSIVFRDITSTGVERTQATLDLHDPAAAAAAAQLLQSLADDRAAVEAWPAALEGEVAYRYARTVHFTRGLDAGPVGDWLLQPLLQEGFARVETTWGDTVVASRAPNRPQYLAALARVPPATERWWPDSYLAYPRVGNRYDTAMKVLTRSRAAAMLLAARLHAAQHGNLPASASDLVPDLLPAIPLDLYLDPVQPLHYRLDPNGPTVWSVFENGLDDHADPKTDLVLGAANPTLPPKPPAPTPPPRPRPATTTRSATTP